MPARGRSVASMKFALVNPPWTFEGSIYFGCREPHLPLEFGYAKALLEAAGHEARDRRRPARRADARGDRAGRRRLRAGRRGRHHGAELPVLALRAAGAARAAGRSSRDLRQVVPARRRRRPARLDHAARDAAEARRRRRRDRRVRGRAAAARARRRATGAAIDVGLHVGRRPSAGARRHRTRPTWRRCRRCAGRDAAVARHRHHHHRFDAAPHGPGRGDGGVARLPVPLHVLREGQLPQRLPQAAARGAPRRARSGCSRQGVEYVYFIDEIFLPNRELLEALAGRDVKFGVQTRIDLWTPEMLDLLGAAGCVSIEAGVESITRARPQSPRQEQPADAPSRSPSGSIYAQASACRSCRPTCSTRAWTIRTRSNAWREHLQRRGVWANKPVPLFPYPGSPDYTKRWGAPDDHAWERALDYYLDASRRVQRHPGRASAAARPARTCSRPMHRAWRTCHAEPRGC